MEDTDARYEIVADKAAFRAWQHECGELWNRPNGTHCQSFSFCWIE